MKTQLKSRDKITQKMTRDGLVEINETKKTKKRISKRVKEADFSKPADYSMPEQTVQQQEAAAPPDPISSDTPPPPEQDISQIQNIDAAEIAAEHTDTTHTRKASKKAVQRAQREAEARARSSRLQFTDEELATPELTPYIEKSNEAADRLDAARAAIPKRKKLVKECTFDETTGKGKTRLHFEEREKPMGSGNNHINPLLRPAQEMNLLIHSKAHSVEKENSGVEGAHKTEELAEQGAKVGARKFREGYHSHKLKPYRAAAKAEKAAEKANVNYQYHKFLHDNPQAASNPLSRFFQKQQIKRQYANAVKSGGVKTATSAAQKVGKAAKQTAQATKNTVSFAIRHWKGFSVATCFLLLFSMFFSGVSTCFALLSGGVNSVVGTSYTSEDEDLVAVEQAYCDFENDLQNKINNIEQDYPGYDEYRYDLDGIFHDPHELASYLTAIFKSYTLSDAQGELQRVFGKQYTLTLTEEVETRYRTETRTGTTTSTNPATGETITVEYEYEVEVPYDYKILNVKLTNRAISSFAGELLTDEQLEMFGVYLETSGNKPLVFGGGSTDITASVELSGVHFVNGTRPGNQAVIDIAKAQVGNVGGSPYWEWYGFESRVEWCACFVSWCYNQTGISEPHFSACQLQGIPWFVSHGQWADRGYSNIAPGDAIFFDWDNDGRADHVGLVIGKDDDRVYTVEGNSGDACKIRSYSLDYNCIKGYGLMNWD